MADATVASTWRGVACDVLVDDLGHTDVGFTDGPASVEVVTPTMEKVRARVCVCVCV